MKKETLEIEENITDLAIITIIQGNDVTFVWYVDNKSTKNRTLTHHGRVTHIYVNKLNIIGSDNGLSPGRRQAIIGTSAGLLLI